MSSYKDQIKDGNWQRRRLEIFNRDNFSCQAADCDKTNNQLEVHHVDYWPGKKIWEYPNDMLVTLCSKCHGKEQGRTELESRLAQTLKMKGFLIGDLLALGVKIDTDENFTKTLLNTLRDFQSR